MDRTGTKLVHTNIQGNDFAYFLKRIEPYRHSLTIVCECTFNRYWLADACQREGLTFVRDFAFLNTVPGIGRSLGPPLLYEIDSIDRFPTVKDFCSYCRLVKGSVASAGKGHRGAKRGVNFWPCRRVDPTPNWDRHHDQPHSRASECTAPRAQPLVHGQTLATQPH